HDPFPAHDARRGFRGGGRRRIQRRVLSGHPALADGRARPDNPPDSRAQDEWFRTHRGGRLMRTDPQAEKKANATKSRLVLHFTDQDEPELWQTELTHVKYAPSRRFAVRGKESGAYVGAETFEWTGAVKVLTAYLLRCAAWQRREVSGVAPPEFPRLEGGK